jgi:1-acyl-sn-glycerol-3-phosphate acyltransferase
MRNRWTPRFLAAEAHGAVRTGRWLGSSRVRRGVLVARLQRVFWRALLGLRSTVEVFGSFPDVPCVVVANHRSICDTPALLSVLPPRMRPVVVLATPYWEKHPVRGPVSRVLMRCVYVHRDGGGYADLMEVLPLLRSGRSVVVFPEGTRTRTGDLGAFRSGAFTIARTAGVPVLPVGLTGTSDVLPVDTVIPRRGSIGVRVGELLADATPDEAREVIAGLVSPNPKVLPVDAVIPWPRESVGEKVGAPLGAETPDASPNSDVCRA